MPEIQLSILYADVHWHSINFVHINRHVSPSINISIAENADFTVPDPLQVTIPAGPIPSSPVCVLIMATEDTQIEGDHGFTVSINQPSLSGVIVGSPRSAVVTIIDNDGMFQLGMKIGVYCV